MKLLTQLFLGTLIIVKIVLGSVFIYQAELDPIVSERDAIASEEVQKEPAEPVEIVQETDKSPNEVNIDLDSFLAKQAELREQEQELAKKREELLAIQEEIDNKIVELTRLRNEIKAMMARKETVEQDKIRHLIKVYSAMKPQKAASLVEKLDMKFAIELLSRMKGDVVGNILSFVNVEKAARISEALGKRK
jgi:flagellar motility protein MotE (MotC chaperone)